MSKFAGESANLSKNVRRIRNLSIVWRKKPRKYLIFIPPSFLVGPILEWNRPSFYESSEELVLAL